MNEFIRTLWTDESGQDMAEYGLLIALIALVVAGGATLLGTQIDTKFGEVVTELGGTP